MKLAHDEEQGSLAGSISERSPGQEGLSILPRSLSHRLGVALRPKLSGFLLQAVSVDAVGVLRRRLPQFFESERISSSRFRFRSHFELASARRFRNQRKDLLSAPAADEIGHDFRGVARLAKYERNVHPKLIGDDLKILPCGECDLIGVSLPALQLALDSAAGSQQRRIIRLSVDRGFRQI